MPIDDTEKYLISSHFELVFSFIEDALKSSPSLVKCGGSRSTEGSDNDTTDMSPKNEDNDYEIDYSSEENKKIMRSFFQLYDIPTDKSDTDILDNKDLDEISDLQIKNKLIQLLIKSHYKSYSQNKKRILIHCSMGVSRSPALIIMYLMKKVKLSFDSVSII